MRRAGVALAVLCALSFSAAADDKSFFRFGDPEPGRKTAKGCVLPVDPTLHMKGLFKGALLMTTYRRQIYERIAAGTPCTCETFFPSFDDALAEFHEQPNPDRWKERERLVYENERKIDFVADEVEAACRAAGVL